MTCNKQGDEIKIEQENHDLIQSLGDISVKSLFSNDVAICKNGIKELSEISLEFLKIKKNNEERYKIIESDMFGNVGKNQYVHYVINELDRIFFYAVKRGNSDVCEEILKTLSVISDETLSNKNNKSIVKKLIGTNNRTGSIYMKIMKNSITYGSQLEKDLSVDHLVSIPQITLAKKHHLDFMRFFINHHTFQIMKLIIDEKDFETFKNVIDMFSKARSFGKSSYTMNRLIDSLHTHYFNLDVDNEIHEYIEKLLFILNHEAKKDFEKISDFNEQLENCQNTLISKICDDKKQDQIKKIFQEISKEISKFYISSLICGVFFKIGAYLISKGDDHYLHYMKELWYHTKPEPDSLINHLNSTPVSKDAEWNILYGVYKGTGSIFYDDDIDSFGDFLDSETYYLQYAILVTLVRNEIIQFPDMSEIASMSKNNQDYQINYYFKLIREIRADRFLKALDKIKHSSFLKIIRYDDEKIKNIHLSDIEHKWNKLDKDKNNIEDNFISMKPIDSHEIKSCLEQIKQKYFEQTHADKIFKILYNSELDESKFHNVEKESSIPRGCFIENPVVVMSSVPHEDMYLSEIVYIFTIIEQKINVKNENTKDFLEQIKNGIQHLKNAGYKPDIIFLPRLINIQINRKNPTSNKMEIDEQEYYVISSPMGSSFKDIIIFDSSCLLITYPTKEDRIISKVGETKKGEKTIKITASIKLIVECIDSNGFIRFNNNEIHKLISNKDETN